MGQIKWLLSWDFHGRARLQTFYQVFRAEFGETPDVSKVLANTYLCCDDFTARRLRALVEYYGGNTIAFAVNGASLDMDPAANREAHDFVERVHAARLSKRGRRPQGQP